MWFFHVKNEKICLKVDRSGQLYLPKQNYCYKKSLSLNIELEVNN